MQNSFANGLLLIGAILFIAGLIAKTGVLSWFGNLPGDIHIKGENFQFFLPLGSIIVVSIVISLGLALLRRFW
ncbi:MAG: DUF2905 family protein [Pseudomonadota bacterium]